MARMRQNLTVLGVEKCQSPITPCHPRRSPPNTRVDTHKTLHDTLRHGEFVPGGVHGLHDPQRRSAFFHGAAGLLTPRVLTQRGQALFSASQSVQ